MAKKKASGKKAEAPAVKEEKPKAHPGAEELDNDRHELFCQEYLVDLNGTQAAIRAGYTEDPNGAAVAGSRLLINAKVLARLDFLMIGRKRRTGINQDKVLERLDRIADAAETIGDFSSAIKANELIGKHQKMFTDRLEIKDTSGLAQRLAAARRRKAK